MLHGLADIGETGRQSLSLVKCLGAHFTGVIDAHQPGDFASLGFSECFVFEAGRWGGSLRGAAAGHQGAQSLVELYDQLIQSGKL
jgi:hypothetical protein